MDRMYEASDKVQRALRDVVYRVACQYGEIVRKAQAEDNRFVRSVSLNPRDFIFTC